MLILWKERMNKSNEQALDTARWHSVGNQEHVSGQPYLDSTFIQGKFQIDSVVTCSTLSLNTLNSLLPDVEHKWSPYHSYPYGISKPLKPEGQVYLMCERKKDHWRSYTIHSYLSWHHNPKEHSPTETCSTKTSIYPPSFISQPRHGGCLLNICDQNQQQSICRANSRPLSNQSKTAEAMPETSLREPEHSERRFLKAIPDKIWENNQLPQKTKSLSQTNHSTTLTMNTL